MYHHGMVLFTLSFSAFSLSLVHGAACCDHGCVWRYLLFLMLMSHGSAGSTGTFKSTTHVPSVPFTVCREEMMALFSLATVLACAWGRQRRIQLLVSVGCRVAWLSWAPGVACIVGRLSLLLGMWGVRVALPSLATRLACVWGPHTLILGRWSLFSLATSMACVCGRRSRLRWWGCSVVLLS